VLDLYCLSKLESGDGKAKREEICTCNALPIIRSTPRPFMTPQCKAGSRRKHETGSKESTYRHTEKKVMFWMSPFHVMVLGRVEYLHHYMVL